MSEVRYPYGYGRGTMTMAQLMARYSIGMHPEAARRMFAWLEAQGGEIGIGGGRRACPSNTSQASRDCKSFHQTQRFASGISAYCAWDLVAKNGDEVHRSPYWSEVPKQDSGHPDIVAFGVHCNVRNEPWHLQPADGPYDGFQTWVNAGRPDPAADYPITGNPPVIPPDPGYPPFNPEDSEYSLWPLADKPEVFNGYEPAPADVVEYLQAVMRNQCGLRGLDIDGYFGGDTEDAVKQMQGWNGLVQDGRCGPKSWVCIDSYAVS